MEALILIRELYMYLYHVAHVYGKTRTQVPVAGSSPLPLISVRMQKSAQAANQIHGAIKGQSASGAEEEGLQRAMMSTCRVVGKHCAMMATGVVEWEGTLIVTFWQNWIIRIFPSDQPSCASRPLRRLGSSSTYLPKCPSNARTCMHTAVADV